MRASKSYSLLLILVAALVAEYFFIKSEIGGFHPAEGVVVGVVEYSCRGREFYRYPCWKKVVEYETSPGVRKQIASGVYSNHHPEIGEKVELLINPENSNDARLGGFTGEWFSFYVHLVIVSGIVVVLSLIIYISQDKR